MPAKALADHWAEWRRQVVALIRRDFNSVLADVKEDDIDWDAWRSLYEQGCSPQEAVDSAFLRVANY